MRILSALVSLAFLASAEALAAECKYQSLAPGPDVEAAWVRPVISKLNVRERGPASKVIGSLEPKQWVEVSGACGDWLEIGFGYGRGWIFRWLACQEAPEVVIDTPSRRRREAVEPSPSVWRVSPNCPTYSISGNLLSGKPDEELAKEGMERLKKERQEGEPAT